MHKNKELAKEHKQKDLFPPACPGIQNKTSNHIFEQLTLLRSDKNVQVSDTIEES